MSEAAHWPAGMAPYVTRSTLCSAIIAAALRARAEGALTIAEPLKFRELPPFAVERAPAARGDFATNAALVLAAAAGMQSGALAALLRAYLQREKAGDVAQCFQI